MEKLADADAFRSIGIDRRQALWQVSALHNRPAGVFTGHVQNTGGEEIVLPQMTASEHVVQDYSSLSLSLKAHPLSFIRKKLNAIRITPAHQLSTLPNDAVARVAGLVLVRQRPGTASGICFITIEDETGSANLVVFKNLFDRYRKEIVQSRLLMVEGKVQKEGEVIHVIAWQCYNLTSLLSQLTEPGNEKPLAQTLSRADEKDDKPVSSQNSKTRKPVQMDIFHEGRNFR